MTPRAIVTDIEGTTSSLAFVHEVLFPYSRVRLAAFVAAHAEDVAPILDQVRTEAGDPAMAAADCLALLAEWQDADRKIGPLKTLQGMIWADGYANGDIEGHVYADVVAALQRWNERGIALYVYSSGSVAAQKQLFAHTRQGDLTPLFSNYFDTAVGAKRDSASYRAIADAIGFAPGDILFLSDIEAELEAARSVGLAVMLLARDGGADGSAFPVAASFDDVLP